MEINYSLDFTMYLAKLSEIRDLRRKVGAIYQMHDASLAGYLLDRGINLELSELRQEIEKRAK